MRYALVNNERVLPSPRTTGSCPACGSAVIAKCGSVRIFHWAHRGERACDVWWEPRTEWHCNWQDKFPQPWQEVIRYAPSGEKHIADIQTERGLTIEFQYSHLRPEERSARESFYSNMAWVVSGGRLSGDLPRFLKGRRSFTPAWKKGVHITLSPEEVFPRNWLTCTVPVFFDFENAADLAETTLSVARPLWCLLPGRVFGVAVVLQVSREAFVSWARERAQLLPVRTILKNVAHALVMAQKARQVEIIRLRTAETALHQRRARRTRSFRRNFRRF